MVFPKLVKILFLHVLFLLCSCINIGGGPAGEFKNIGISKNLNNNTNTSFSQARVVLEKSCFPCHSEWISSDEETFRNLVAKNKLLDPLIKAGDSGNSYFIKKIIHNPTSLQNGQGEKMPSLPSYQISLEGYKTLVNWIDGMNVSNQDFVFSFKTKKVDNNSILAFGNVLINSNGTEADLLIQNRTTKTTTLNLAIQQAQYFKFADNQKTSISIGANQTNSVKLKFIPDTFSEFSDVLTVSDGKNSYIFSLKGFGNDTLAIYNLKCNPRFPNYDRTFSLPRLQFLLNTFQYFIFPTSYSAIFDDPEIKNILLGYPLLSPAQYNETKFGGLNESTSEVFANLIIKISNKISNNDSLFSSVMNDMGGPCAGITKVEEISLNCSNYILDEKTKITFNRKIENSKLQFAKDDINVAMQLNDRRSVVFILFTSIFAHPEFFNFDGGSESLGNNYYKSSTPGIIRLLSSIILGTTHAPAKTVDFVSSVLNDNLQNQDNLKKLVNHLYSLTDINGKNISEQNVINLYYDFFRLNNDLILSQSKDMTDGLLRLYREKGINTSNTLTGSLGRDAIYADKLFIKNMLEKGSTVSDLILTDQGIAINDLQKAVVGLTAKSDKLQKLNRPRGGVYTLFSKTNTVKSYYLNPISSFGRWYVDTFYNIIINSPDPATLPPGSLDPPLEDPSLSIREKYEKKTAAPMCQSCHSQFQFVGNANSSINGVGEITEQEVQFDSTGVVTTEHPINTHELFKWKSIERTINGPTELAYLADELKLLHLSIARYAAKLVTSSNDETKNACSISETFKFLVGKDAPAKDVFGAVGLMTNDILVRHFNPNP